jgi:hypothetical protein
MAGESGSEAAGDHRLGPYDGRPELEGLTTFALPTPRLVFRCRDDLGRRQRGPASSSAIRSLENYSKGEPPFKPELGNRLGRSAPSRAERAPRRPTVDAS